MIHFFRVDDLLTCKKNRNFSSPKKLFVLHTIVCAVFQWNDNNSNELYISIKVIWKCGDVVFIRCDLIKEIQFSRDCSM